MFPFGHHLPHNKSTTKSHAPKRENETPGRTNKVTRIAGRKMVRPHEWPPNCHLRNHDRGSGEVLSITSAAANRTAHSMAV